MPLLIRIHVFIFLLLIAISGTAQVFSAYVGPQFEKINSKTFSRFADSYRDNFPGELKGSGIKSLPGTGLLAGISFGTLSGNTDGNPSSFALEYSRTGQTHRAEFTDGAVRKFRMRNNFASFNYGISFPIRLKEGDEFNHYLFIKPELGIGLGSSRIVSSFKEGTSGKTDLNINGTFKTTSGNAMAGLSITCLHHYIGIKCWARYNTQLFAGPLLDKGKRTGEDRLLTDVRNYSNGLIGDEVRNDFKYLQFGIGLVFGLTEED